MNKVKNISLTNLLFCFGFVNIHLYSAYVPHVTLLLVELSTVHALWSVMLQTSGQISVL